VGFHNLYSTTIDGRSHYWELFITHYSVNNYNLLYSSTKNKTLRYIKHSTVGLGYAMIKCLSKDKFKMLEGGSIYLLKLLDP
jgi:hypothetical protein